MIKKVFDDYPRKIEVEILDLEDLLQDRSYLRPFRCSFDDLFGSLITSYSRFHLYVYKLYRKEKRAYYLALWIARKFFQLLRRDLVDNLDQFQFPHSKKMLCVHDHNEDKKNKIYNVRTFGRDYWIEFLPYEGKYFCRLAKPEYNKMIDTILKKSLHG